MRKEKSSIMRHPSEDDRDGVISEEETTNGSNERLKRLNSSYSRSYSMKSSPVTLTTGGNSCDISIKDQEANSLRLSSRQISLLLSSIWAQSISPANMPENYEAIAHTYSLVLLFSRAKNCSHEVLVRSFQLAFSLRNISLKDGGPLPPSRRRSLFTLASSMILFSSKAYHILPLVHCAKVALTDKMEDPFLRLVEESKLQAVNTELNHRIAVYGSKEDDSSALKSLSKIVIVDDQTSESFASEIVKSLENVSDVMFELSDIRGQLLNEFLPDDVCPLGAQFMEKPFKIDQADSESNNSHEAAPTITVEENAFIDSFESQNKHNLELAMEIPNLLSVNQLLESVLETAHQVGRFSISSAPDVPYKEMAHQCEALLMGKQQKMSNLMIVHQRQESLISFSSQNHGNVKVASLSHIDALSNGADNPILDQNFTADTLKPLVGAPPTLCATAYQHNPHSFNLPASSPYDNFLKAAGC